MDKPILFTRAMVRAILEDCKSETRRIVEPQPLRRQSVFDHLDPVGQALFSDGTVARARYGMRGDHLWVREAWAAPAEYDDTPPRAIPAGAPIWYLADGVPPTPWKITPNGFGRTRPGIHMPRWASRLTLKLTHVNVERLQDITPGAVINEGIWPIDHTLIDNNWRRKFVEVWDKINAERGYSWHSNPAVWVLKFVKV